MSRKKLRKSLTARIFLMTCLILFAASAITFGLIAWAMPITYTSVVSESLERQTRALLEQVERVNFDDCGELLDVFIRKNGADVVITDDATGEVVQTPSRLAVEDVAVVTVVEDTVAYDTREEGAAAAEEGFALHDMREEGEGEEDAVYSVTVSSDSPSYPFTFADREETYRLHVIPRMQAVNQAMESLKKAAPWLLAAMLLFSALCAVWYSRYIARPIIRLSGISQKMADLDFSWRCSESRDDEIGTLERNLDTLSDRLSTALSDLREANAALRRDIDRERELEQQRLAFFSAVSHELKTPVTILKGQLAGMLEGVDIYQDRDKYLARSLQVANRMEGLVQEILTVSRMESSAFALRRQELNLSELTRRRVDLMTGLLEQKEVQLQSELADDIAILGDETLLSKALDNLISNAIFYSSAGAVVTVRTALEENRPHLTVENSGAQIPEDALPHLFEAFYRVEQSRSRSTGGSGLGLYLVKMILDRHNADCHIANTAGGVRFSILFPPIS